MFGCAADVMLGAIGCDWREFQRQLHHRLANESRPVWRQEERPNSSIDGLIYFKPDGKITEKVIV